MHCRQMTCSNKQTTCLLRWPRATSKSLRQQSRVNKGPWKTPVKATSCSATSTAAPLYPWRDKMQPALPQVWPLSHPVAPYTRRQHRCLLRRAVLTVTYKNLACAVIRRPLAQSGLLTGAGAGKAEIAMSSSPSRHAHTTPQTRRQLCGRGQAAELSNARGLRDG